MKTETPKQIAERVVEKMFTNGSKSKANRLVLVQENQSGAARIENAVNLGGWSRAPLIDFIEEAIKAERERAAKIAETYEGHGDWCSSAAGDCQSLTVKAIAAAIRGSKQ